MRPAVFFDRDDTLIRCRSLTADGDLGDPALVQLLPGAAAAVARLHQTGFVLVVITNQGGIARGKYQPADVEAVHTRLNQLLEGRISGFRFCPWHPQAVVPEYKGEHPWRKPAPGMILDAADELGIDLTRSWVVGDSPRDCAAGRAAGCRTILIGQASPTSAEPCWDYQAADITAAAAHILADCIRQTGS